MKTKIIPFNLELAKKITSGEVEGRIVAKSKNGYLSVSLKQIDTISSILNIYHGVSHVEVKYGHNSMLQYLEGCNMIFIELPEETSITFHTDIPNGHAEIHGDTISFVNEEIPDITTSEDFHRAFNKHEFKVGDKVSIGDYNEEDVEIYTIVKIRENLAFLNDGSTIPLDGLVLRESKHEFKPFDKVLVRNGMNCIWQPSIFSYQLGDCCYTVSSYPYEKENIIPYEGNERLVGTTDCTK